MNRKNPNIPNFEIKQIRFPGHKKRWPSLRQWKNFFKVLTKREKFLLPVFVFAFLFSFIFLSSSYYLENTQIAAAEGGSIIEGVLNQSQPLHINPVYANSDIARDLTELVFSGLMKYSKDMEVVPDLARDYPEMEEEGKVYKFYLKENIYWQDGTPITADDIVFTIKTMQNTDINSPYLANWVGVKAEKVNDVTVKFTLQKPYATFLENCTIKIMPRHIWEQVPIANFSSDPRNTVEQTIGSGRYKVKEVRRDNLNRVQYLILERNNLYYGQKPNINEIKFLFFDNLDDLIKAAQKGKITGFSLSSKQDIRQFQENELRMPRYFAAFFNQEESSVLKIKEVRMALNYATDKEELEEKKVNSPLLPEFYGFENPEIVYEFDIDKAKELLDQAGFADENGDGIREKTISKEPAFTFKSQLTAGSSGKEVEELQKCLAKFEDVYPNGTVSGYFGSKTKDAVIKFQEKFAEDILKPAGLTAGTGTLGKGTRTKLNEVCFDGSDEFLELRFSLATISQPQMIETANTLKEQWSKIGVDLQIQEYDLFSLEQDVIKPRSYDILLFGEVLGAIPDPFPFWHSSQTKDPGYNLALYQNKKADELLEENRKSSDSEFRKEKLNELQNIINQDVPAVFLYGSGYYYYTSTEIKEVSSQKIIDPSKRFSDIEEWYIETKRIWK